MLIRSYLFLILSLFVFYSSNRAQSPFRFEKISIEQGLSHSEVNTIIQDSTGFIWIGTRNGLNRFDGSNFIHYYDKPNEITSIPSSDIRQLLKDRGDDFWVVTKRGTAYYDAVKGEMLQLPFLDVDGIQYTYHVNHLLKDHAGEIIAATSNGIFKFDISEKKFLKYPVPNPDFQFVNHNGIQVIATDNLNRLWLGTLNKGLFVFDQKQDKVIELVHRQNGVNTLFDNKIFSVFQDSYGIIWVGAETGLYSFNEIGATPVRYLPSPKHGSLPHHTVNSIYEDSRSRLWILTNGGVSLFNRESGLFENYYHEDFNPASLSSNAFRTMFEDFQGNLWLGAVEDGINIVKVHDIEFENYTRIPNNPLSLNYPQVLSIVEDNDNNLWVGTNGGGLNVIDKNRSSVRYILHQENNPFALNSDAIMGLYKHTNGSIYIGTYLGGMTIYNPEKKSFRTYRHNPDNQNSLVNDVVNGFSAGPDGSVLVATNKGVDLFDPVTETFSRFGSPSSAASYEISNNYITGIILDEKKNELWIASHYGLNRINLSSHEVTKYHHTGLQGEIGDNSVFCILMDSQDRLWAGTDNGLCLFNPESGDFSIYRTEHGLPNNSINGILEDFLGNIWLSTLNGLAKLDMKDENFYSFGLDDGMATIEFSLNAAYRGSDGKLYFGGRKGLIAFDPLMIKIPDYKSPLVFTNLYINNQPAQPGKDGSPLQKALNYTRKLVLRHDQSFLTFDFTTLNYINPRKDRFYYMLEGFDSDWISVGNSRSAYYTRLPAGNYTFKVRAIQNFNQITNSLPLDVEVKPPFWLSRMAYLFYFLVLIVIIYSVWRFFHDRALYNRLSFVQKVESEKLIELNQAKLRFFINVAHEFKTPLTLILSPLELLVNRGIKSQPAANVTKTIQTAYRNALRLSRLVSQIMELRRIDTGSLKLAVHEINIVNHIREICTNFDDFAHNHDIDFDVITPYEEFMLWVDADKIEKAFFNLLSNAFRFTPERGEITVTIRTITNVGTNCPKAWKSPHGFLCIDVKDTGPGIQKSQQEKIFERFYQNNNDVLSDPASTGIGLSIVKEFVEIHKGCIQLSSEPGKGSIFTMILPIGKEHYTPEDFAPSSYDDLRKYVAPTETEEKRTGVKPFFHETARGYPHKILVVEDNHELRNFILDNLESKYEVHEADNGREGLRMAETIHPDLIVSDIMMPGISGIELVKKIKSNINTSHIPVILMTVLGDLSHQVEGIETGADAYIVKPFHFSLLEANINSLIENRRAIINKFLTDDKAELASIPVSKLDQAIMKKAMEVLEKNMDNENFTAEEFSQEMNMSRSNLHVKLKALTNLSATEFIRNVRLKKSVELLSQQEYTVSQVAAMVGFKSISYFNRCFKNAYGQSPSNYI
jgi:signal transduction histidine kinase/ligand-binding sensor domain-containing protein/DNA-binding response OmpR family regulator